MQNLIQIYNIELLGNRLRELLRQSPTIPYKVTVEACCFEIVGKQIMVNDYEPECPQFCGFWCYRNTCISEETRYLHSHQLETNAHKLDGNFRRVSQCVMVLNKNWKVTGSTHSGAQPRFRTEPSCENPGGLWVAIRIQPSC